MNAHTTRPELGSFNWEDALWLEDQLTDEERLIRDAAKAYGREQLQPRIIGAYRQERVDPTVFREMGEMGPLGVTVPDTCGGAGAGYVSYGLVAREVERVDSGYRSMMSVQSIGRYLSFYNEVRPLGAIGNMPPIVLKNCGDAASSSPQWSRKTLTPAEGASGSASPDDGLSVQVRDRSGRRPDTALRISRLWGNRVKAPKGRAIHYS